MKCFLVVFYILPAIQLWETHADPALNGLTRKGTHSVHDLVQRVRTAHRCPTLSVSLEIKKSVLRPLQISQRQLAPHHSSKSFSRSRSLELIVKCPSSCPDGLRPRTRKNNLPTAAGYFKHYKFTYYEMMERLSVENTANPLSTWRTHWA